MKKKLFTLFTLLLCLCSTAWAKVITWNTADNSTSNDVACTAGTNVTWTGDDGATVLSYVYPKSNKNKKLMNNGGFYMNEATQYQSSTCMNYFTFKAPSSTGKVSFTFATIDGGTSGKTVNIRICGGTTVSDDYTTVNSSVTSSTICGLQTGSSDVIIILSKKCTIKEVKWTDADAPNYTTLFANDFTATPMGVATVAYTNMASSNVTSWIGYASSYSGYNASLGSGKATLTFGTPLALASNGTDRGRIRVFWGWNAANKTIALKVNGSSVAFSPTNVANTIFPNMLMVSEYTIPNETSTISSIEPSCGSGGLYLFRIEVLSYAAAPGTIVFSPTDENSVETGAEVTLSSANATTIKYQWGSSAVGNSGDWSGAETYSDSNKPEVPAVGSSNNVLSVWAHNNDGDTYGSATYTIIAAKTAVTLAYETTSATITGNEALTQPVLNVTGATKAALIEAGALEFTSSDNAVAEVDANGVITTKKYSETPVVITAKIENNETYSDASATFTLTINHMNFDKPTITFNGNVYNGTETEITGLTSGAQITINLPSGASAYGNWSSSQKTNVSDAYPSKPTGTTVSTSTGGTRYLYLVAGNEWGYSPIVNFKFTGVVASDPVFKVASGLLAKDATVNISTLDQNDVVHYEYTTDGTEPEDPTTSSTTIVDGSHTNANLDIFATVSTYKIKAKAFAKDNSAHGSAVVSREYIVTEDELASITPAYNKTTYVTTEKLDFSGVNGLKAYVATGSGTGTVTMTSVNAVPEATPLMLVGTASTTYNVPVAASASAPATNYLKAGPATFDGTEEDKYILYSDGIFYLTGAGTLAEGKAYLDLSALGARKLSVVFEDNTATAINGIVEVAPVIKTRKVVKNGRLVIETANGEFTIDGARVK